MTRACKYSGAAQPRDAVDRPRPPGVIARAARLVSPPVWATYSSSRARRDRPTAGVPAGGGIAQRRMARGATTGAVRVAARRPATARPVHVGVQVEADARTRARTSTSPTRPGRLILLHDPAGQDAWEGTFRLVCFVQARLEREQLGDEMLPVVGWSWLTEALDQVRRRSTSPSAAPSPRRPRCGSATSPDPAATTTSSCGRPGRPSVRRDHLPRHARGVLSARRRRPPGCHPSAPSPSLAERSDEDCMTLSIARSPARTPVAVITASLGRVDTLSTRL